MRERRPFRSPLNPVVGPVNRAAAGLTPYGIERLQGATTDQVECLQRVALDIFTDMTNAGYGFQQALASIYLSGLQHAAQIIKRQENAEHGSALGVEPQDG